VKIQNRKTKITQVLFWIMRSAFLTVIFVAVPGERLHAGDQLLKEYIYFDGRLLAVERQIIPTIAQFPAGKPDQVPQLEAINNWFFISDDVIQPQPLRDSSDSTDSKRAAMHDREDAMEKIALREKPERGKPIND
jgi:hypothetical protein